MLQENKTDDIAARWVARVSAGPLSATEQVELDDWLAASPRHFGAYERLQAVNLRLQRIRGIGHELKNIAPDPVREVDIVAALDEGTLEGMDGPSRSYGFGRRGAIAAGLSGLFVFGLFGLRAPATARTFRTARGEVRLIPLDDGSTITLNTASAIEVRSDVRGVALLEGEAFVQVSGDLSSPFRLSAGRLDLTCAQSKFCISRVLEEQPVLLVQQGTVNISVGGSQAVPVDAGTKAVLAFPNKLTLSRISANDLERQLLWREGMISFSGTTLFDAAWIFRRYSDVSIIITDPEIGSLTITGVYSANDPAGFVRTVARAFDLDVEQTSNGFQLTNRA